MSVSERAIHIGILVSAALACGLVFGVPRGSPRHAAPTGGVHEAEGPRASALSLIPSGSAFVISADIRRLQHTPLAEVLSQRLGRAGRTGDFAKSCGLDPLARLDQLALAVPSASLAAPEHPEDFGIVAQGRFTAAEIMLCARAVIAQRGGEPIETQLRAFRAVRDPKQSGEIAARDGILIVSGGSYFRALLDAAEGHTSQKRGPQSAQHAELRRALGGDRGVIAATWLLGEHWFERVAGEDSNARLSPLSALRALAAQIELSDTTHVQLLLDSTDREGARRVASLLSELRSSLHSLPLDPALASLAERVSVSRSGARLKLAVDPTQDELSALLGLLLGP